MLVVDDLPINRTLAVEILQSAGHAFSVAENGEEAVQRLGRERFDLILMDVDMPVMDGLAATASIRKLGGAAGATPIVVLTAQAMPDQVTRCIDSGMNDVLIKPFTRETLLNTVGRWIGAFDKTSDLKPPNSLGHVVVVEDDPIFAAAILSLLCERGFQAEIVGVASLAFAHVAALLAAKVPSVVLLDLSLLDQDGRPLLESLRSRWFSDQLPVVILSGRDLCEAATAALLRCGADRVLRKPVQFETLVGVLSEQFARLHAVTAGAAFL